VAMRGAAPHVLGVMNLRGRIVPVSDLALWLGTGRVEADEHSRIIVLEHEDELMGVLVSALDDVASIDADSVEQPFAATAPGAVLGIARSASTPTVLLDAVALFGARLKSSRQPPLPGFDGPTPQEHMAPMAETSHPLELQADLGIEHVAELQAALAPHLATEGPLAL